MNSSIFFEFEFWLLVVFSVVVPIAIYSAMLRIRAVSPFAVALLGVALLMIAGLDLYLLGKLRMMAAISPSILDDAAFRSELSLGFYLFPALFGGVGVNLISHVLIRHLSEAERKYEREHPDA